MTIKMVAERLGGAAVLGREVHSDLELALVIRDGLPYQVLEHVLQSGDLETREACALLFRKHEERRDLSPVESDRLVRAVRTIARAEEALGDGEKSHRWLRAPNRALAGNRPLDLLESHAGARAVERALGRIAHGIYS